MIPTTAPPVVRVTATPGLATVQDGGRMGAMRHGVGMAGAMDKLALKAGNLLLGNEVNAAGIEIPIFPFTVRFSSDCAFALTGADCRARIAGRAVLPWSVGLARAGEELALGLPQGPPGLRGSRAYLLLPGGVDVPQVLGSRSTQIRGAFGGLDGRPLRIDDELRAATSDPVSSNVVSGFGLMPPALSLPLQADGIPLLRVLPAAEYECFTPVTLDRFWAGTWKITPQSDRYGYRLAGEGLEFLRPLEMLSHGIVPGVIQVPPGGQPIIQMSDAQPSGGYPKLGTVIEADLWRLGQAAPGSRIHFVRTDWNGALAASAAVETWLSEVGRAARLWRAHAGEPSR